MSGGGGGGGRQSHHLMKSKWPNFFFFFFLKSKKPSVPILTAYETQGGVERGGGRGEGRVFKNAHLQTLQRWVEVEEEEVTEERTW